MYVNTDVTYDNVDFDSTISNNWIVDVFGNLTVNNELNISASDSDATGYVVGLGVTGEASVVVAEGTTINLQSTVTEPTDEVFTRYGVNLDAEAFADLGNQSLVTISSAIDNGRIGGSYLSDSSEMTGGSLEMRLTNTSGISYGIEFGASDNQVSFDRLIISATGERSVDNNGVWAEGIGIVSLKNDTDEGRTTVSVGDLSITAAGTDAAVALYSDGAITVRDNDQTTLIVTVTADESNAWGISATARKDGDVDMLFGDLGITATGAYNANGIDLYAEGTVSNAISAKSLTINATGSNDAYGINMDDGDVSVGGNTNIVAKGGDHVKGVMALSGGHVTFGKEDPQGTSQIETTGNYSYGIDIGRGDSEAEFFNKAVICAESTGKQAFGVYLRTDSQQMTGTVAFHNGLYVEAIGGTDQNRAISAHGAGSLFLVENGLTAKAEDTAVFAQGTDDNATVVSINEAGGVTLIESDKRAVWAYGSAEITVGGDVVQMQGDILSVGTADGVGVINAQFSSSDSYLTGKVSNKRYAAVTTDGIANLTFSSGARWNLTDTSSLNTLSLDNGTVDMTQDGQGYSQLEIDDLNGSGVFRMDVDVDNEKNDLILVHGGVTTHRPSDEVSSHVVEVASSGKASADASGVMIHSDAGVAVNFALRETSAGAKVDLGNYLYELVRKDNVVEGGYDWRLEKAGISPSAEAVAAMAGSGAQTAQYLDRLSDLYKRLGDVRQGVRDGLWASAQGRKDRISGFGGTGFKQDVYGFNIGYDRAVGSWIIGSSFSASFADQKTHGTNFSATGDADSQGVSLYATYLGESDQYADFVLTVDRYSQDIETRMLDGRDVKGDYSSFGFGLSAEVGKRFEFDGMGGIFVEPQAQLSWYRVNGKDFDLSNEMSVSQDDLNSLNGRVGVLVGRTFALSEESWAQFYVKGGVNHEFLDDQEIRINGERFEDDFLGTRGYYGLGVDWQVSRNTRFWAQVEREEGSDYTKEFEANIGVKYQF